MSYIEIKVPQAFSNTAGLLPVPDLASNLLLDYDADTLVASVANNAAITSIASTGSNTTALSAVVGSYTRPTLKHAAVNGHASLAFDGSQVIQTPTTGALLAEGAVATFVSVFKTTSAASDSRVWAYANGGSVASFRALTLKSSGPGIASMNAASSTTVETSPQPYTHGQWIVAVQTYAATQVSQYTSLASAVRTITYTTPGALAGLSLGANSAATVRMTGEIAMLRAYNRLLTATEVSGLIDVLCAKYGITRVTS